MTWRVDSTTSSPLDSRAVIDSDSLGQWDLISTKDGRKIQPVVIIDAIEQYVPAVRRKKRMPDGKMVPEKLNKLKIFLRNDRGPIKKYLICNQVNRKTLQALFGTTMQAWIGKKIQLYVDDEVTMGRQKTGGLRIKNTRPDGQPATAEALDREPDQETVEKIDEAKAEFEEDAG